MTPSRPRVEGERENEILDATLAELLHSGYDRLTMDAVARRSRASKATLYRRWESKAALVVDAVGRSKGGPAPGVPDTGSLRSDLVATYCGGPDAAGQEGTRVMGAVVTGMTNDAEFAALFRERFIAPKVGVSREIYDRAAQRGELRDDLDLDVVAPALAGVLLHRAFILGAPSDDAVVERVIDHLILPAVLAQPSPNPPPSPEMSHP